VPSKHSRRPTAWSETEAVTLAVEDDFAGFVAARWTDLVAVAGVACLEPQTAFAVTADSLAALRRRWPQALEDGAPTREARAELLRGVTRLTVRSDGGRAADAHRTAAAVRLDGWSGTDGPDVAEVLLDALRQESPLLRSALAASVVWGLDDAETAALIAGPADRLGAEVSASRARLAAAHRAALERQGVVPSEQRFARDLERVVHEIAAVQPGPPDPGELARSPGRGVTRRSLVIGGTALVGLGATGWWLGQGMGETDSSTGPAPSPGPPSVEPDDAVWSSTARWPVRGAVGGDLDVGRAVAATAGRLLWADDVGNRRLAVAVVSPTSTGSTVRVWSGAANTASGRLDPVPLARDRVDGVGDVVAVAAPSGEGSILVVLARPTVEVAELSAVVRPTAQGAVERRWRTITLREGVGTLELDEPLGPAARVRCGGFDGPPAGSTTMAWAPQGPPSSGEVARRATTSISRATGIPVGRLRTRVVIDAPAGGNIIDPYATAPAPGQGRVVVTNTSTPDGAVVRAVHVQDDAGEGSTGRFWGPFTVLAAGDADAPVVRRVTDLGPKIARFLVVAPGAARARLLVTTPDGSSASEATRIADGAAIAVVVYNVTDASHYQLDLWDEAGRMTYSAVPPYGAPLLDLG
jgi:hypothetical protein